MDHALCHCTALRKATRRLSSRYDQSLKPLGVNVAQFSLLRNIKDLAPVSLTDLSGAVELDRSTVGRNARVLQRMGLVSMGHGKDQREAMLKITDDGRVLLARGKPIWDGMQGEVEARLGREDTETLHRLLSAL